MSTVATSEQIAELANAIACQAEAGAKATARRTARRRARR